MFKPKLIVTDLDGSALRKDKTISERTRNAFKSCHTAGIHIAIATARYIYGAKPYAKALHADYQILTDGTLVYQQDSLIYSNTMDLPTTNAILQELYRQGCTSHIAIPTAHGLFRYPKASLLPVDNTGNTQASKCINATGNTPHYHFDITKPFPYPANKMVVELPSEALAEAIAAKCHCSQFHYRGENRYTFFHPTASKLDAISFLAKKLGITLQDILVFGDDTNDIEMIAHCGMGIAMGNALEEVKAIADKIIDTNENDGIALFLEKSVLQQKY